MTDLILRAGRVIDPAGPIDAVSDVAVAGGLVAAVGPDLPCDWAEVIDCRGLVVTPAPLLPWTADRSGRRPALTP